MQEALELGKMYGKMPVGDNVLPKDISTPELEREPWREDWISLGKVFKEEIYNIVITKTEWKNNFKNIWQNRTAELYL